MKNTFFSTLILMFGASTYGYNFSFPRFANPEIRRSSNFVKIKAGSFQMGSPASENGRYDNEDLHDVTISRDFEIQSTVVTQAQYFLAMGYNPSYFNFRSFCSNDYVEINSTELCPNNPVESVSWNDTQDFINKLNATDAEYSYRLPTEAEWEYSARAGSQAAYWYGSDANSLADYAWFRRNSDTQTHAVGSKPANTWGLYDAHGNVWQWVSDWYGKYSTSRQTDPVGASSGSYRVLRGGSWDNIKQHLRSGYRYYESPGNRYGFDGFRLVRTHK